MLPAGMLRWCCSDEGSYTLRPRRGCASLGEWSSSVCDEEMVIVLHVRGEFARNIEYLYKNYWLHSYGLVIIRSLSLTTRAQFHVTTAKNPKQHLPTRFLPPVTDADLPRVISSPVMISFRSVWSFDLTPVRLSWFFVQSEYFVVHGQLFNVRTYPVEVARTKSFFFLARVKLQNEIVREENPSPIDLQSVLTISCVCVIDRLSTMYRCCRKYTFL